MIPAKAVVGGILLAALTPAVALAQGPTPGPTPTPPAISTTALAAGLADWSFWATVLVTVVAGALGGLVYELVMLQGNVEWPHKSTAEEVTDKYPYAIYKFMFDLGILARVIIGGLAAVAALLVLAPSTTFGLLATSVVAGSAGISVFHSLQDRLLAGMAQKDAADTKDKADKLAGKVDDALKAFAALKTKLSGASARVPGVTTMSFAAGATLDAADLDKVEQLLSEAKGLHESLA